MVHHDDCQADPSVHRTSVVGLLSLYRCFRDFSTTALLTSMTRKNAKWKWRPEEDAAFRKLKQALTSASILACPDFERSFTVQTDQHLRVGGGVVAKLRGRGFVIAYASRTLNGAEKSSATELECLAVVCRIRHLRGYLEGYTFTVVTDHQALRWLQKIDFPIGRLGRWALEL